MLSFHCLCSRKTIARCFWSNHASAFSVISKQSTSKTASICFGIPLARAYVSPLHAARQTKLSFATRPRRFHKHLMLTLGLMGSKCLWDNLRSIFGEVSSPNFRQEKRCGRGCSAADKGTCPVTRLI